MNLTSSNVEVAGDIFAFDVTIGNLIGQSLGTYRTGSPHPDGVRVFFAAGPASGEGGEIRVANPDGSGTFTGTSQPYFQYEGPLDPGGTTLPRRWRLQFDENVSTFNFTLYVSAPVRFPDGYVDGFPELVILDPNESRTLGELTVRTMTGRPVPGAHVTLYSRDPTIITVSGFTVTASEVGSYGLPIDLGIRGDVPSSFFPATVRVVICQSSEVEDGFAKQTFLSARSCASAFSGAEYNADLYRVALTSGQTLTVTMRRHPDTPQFDPRLELANRQKGTVVAGNDDDPAGVLGKGSRIVYTASESGVYVIEATSSRRGETGLYVLEVSID